MLKRLLKKSRGDSKDPGEVCDVKVAVIGQPNVGKSTLFNILTGKLVRVGNFPGTTVSMTIGVKRYRDKNFCFVDLPGIYSLKPSSSEEKISRDYLLFGDWDLVLVLVDPLIGPEAFYLAIQVLQITSRVVIALTKWDEVERSGLRIDLEKIRRSLGVPVVAVSALKKIGLEDLMEKLYEASEKSFRENVLVIDYGDLENVIKPLEEKISRIINSKISPRGVAVLIAMGDRELVSKLGVERDLVDSLANQSSLEDLFAETMYRYTREVVAN